VRQRHALQKVTQAVFSNYLSTHPWRAANYQENREPPPRRGAGKLHVTVTSRNQVTPLVYKCRQLPEKRDGLIGVGSSTGQSDFERVPPLNLSGADGGGQLKPKELGLFGSGSKERGRVLVGFKKKRRGTLGGRNGGPACFWGGGGRKLTIGWVSQSFRGRGGGERGAPTGSRNWGWNRRRCLGAFLLLKRLYLRLLKRY